MPIQPARLLTAAGDSTLAQSGAPIPLDRLVPPALTGTPWEVEIGFGKGRYLFERCYLELADLVSNAIASRTTFSAKQRAVIDAYLAALDRDPNSVLYVQDWLRHFWPKMPDRVRRHSIVGDVRGLLELGRGEGRVTEDIDINLLTTAWLGTLQQFTRFRYFGEFTQPTRALAAALDALLTKMARP